MSSSDDEIVVPPFSAEEYRRLRASHPGIGSIPPGERAIAMELGLARTCPRCSGRGEILRGSLAKGHCWLCDAEGIVVPDDLERAKNTLGVRTVEEAIRDYRDWNEEVECHEQKTNSPS